MQYAEEKGSFVAIPTKKDFEGMVRARQGAAVQALCNLPCGQPCVCSCKVSEDAKPQEQYRF